MALRHLKISPFYSKSEVLNRCATQTPNSVRLLRVWVSEGPKTIIFKRRSSTEDLLNGGSFEIKRLSFELKDLN